MRWGHAGSVEGVGARSGKDAIPRKMETPGLTMRMGADALGRADHEDFSMLIGERFFISGNSEPLFYSVKRVYMN